MKPLGLVPDISPNTSPYFEIKNHHSKNYLEYIYIFNGLLIFYSTRIKPVFGTLSPDQLELPLEAVEWLVNVIEQKFMRKPSEGGLDKDVFNTSQEIAGEDLYIRWGVSVAGEGIGGYTIKNHTRQDYAEKWNSSQSFVIAGDIMTVQVLPVLKEIAQKHKNGTL